LISATVEKTFGDFKLSVEFESEKFIRISGPNGSGKTTLLRIIAGLLPLDYGQIKLNSKDITRLPVEKRSVAFVSTDSLIPHLDVKKHLVWGASRKGVKIDAAHLKKVRDALGINFEGRMEQLSLGMRIRVSLATSLLSKPQLILADEVFSNIHERKDFVSSYRELAIASNIDVIYSSQLSEDSTIADHHYQMQKGQMMKLF
jgi:ABC-type Fe3+/spermidine/putrescine transport system ATPase subunit